MILSNDRTRIISLIDRLNSEVKALLQACIEISYFLRSTPYHDVLQMSALERDLSVEFINKRLEAASKMSFPVF